MANPDDDKLLDKLIKLMKMTTSPNEGEAITAMRMANGLLTRGGYDWEALLRGKITVVADPFASAPAAAPVRRPAQGFTPVRPRPAAPKNPTTPPWTPPPTPLKPKPASNWQQNINKQPAPKQVVQPSLAFRKDDHGHWCIGSDQTLQLGSIHTVIRKDGSAQRVEIKAFASKNKHGDNLYRFIDAGPGSIF